MNNESGALVNLPLPLPQPLALLWRKALKAPSRLAPAFTPTATPPPPPCSSSLGLAQAPEWKDSEGKRGGFRLGSGVRAGSPGPEVGSPGAALLGGC